MLSHTGPGAWSHETIGVVMMGTIEVLERTVDSHFHGIRAFLHVGRKVDGVVLSDDDARAPASHEDLPHAAVPSAHA